MEILCVFLLVFLFVCHEYEIRQLKNKLKQIMGEGNDNL
jgi:hypothetical protein